MPPRQQRRSYVRALPDNTGDGYDNSGGSRWPWPRQLKGDPEDRVDETQGEDPEGSRRGDSRELVIADNGGARGAADSGGAGGGGGRGDDSGCEAAGGRSACCAANLRALWATFLLNTAFTFAQVIGATAANSLALLGDTGTMFVDSVTYAINIFAELNKHRFETHSLEIGASLFSVAALCTVTAFVMRDAIGRLSRSRGGEAGSGEGSGEVEGEVEGEEVDPIIMLTFTCFNLLVDFGMFASILLRRRGGGGGSACCLCPYFLRPAPPNAAASDELQDEAAEGGAGAGGAAGGAAAEDAAALNLNMCSALAHVVADTMRTLTVMGCALLVAFCGYDAEHTDAMGSLLVCCIVLAIAAYISFEATAELHAHRRRARAEAGGALQLARSEAMPRIVEEC